MDPDFSEGKSWIDRSGAPVQACYHSIVLSPDQNLTVERPGFGVDQLHPIARGFGCVVAGMAVLKRTRRLCVKDLDRPGFGASREFGRD